MKKYPTSNFLFKNLWMTMPIGALMLFAMCEGVSKFAMIWIFLGFPSLFIIPMYCEKNHLLKGSKSLLKVAWISLMCTLPWFFVLIVSMISEESYQLTGKHCTFFFLLGLAWLKDFIVTNSCLPNESCETKNRHVPYWLLIVIPIITVWLEPTALASSNYEIRTYVPEGVAMSTIAKTASADFYKKHQRFPKDNLEAKLQNPTEINGQAVRSVAIQPNSLIVVTYNRKVKDGGELWMQAVVEKDEVSWQCIEGIDPDKAIELKFIPTNCRNQIQQVAQKKLEEK